MSSIRSSPEALYATQVADKNEQGGVKRHLCRYDFATCLWATRELPLEFRPDFRLMNGNIYLTVTSYTADHVHKEVGLARYDWKSGQATILTSNRRRPGWNQFDDRDAYEVLGLFLGPRNKPCFTTFGGTYYIQETPGQWPSAFDGAFADRTIEACGKTLAYNPAGEVTVMNP